MTIALRYLRSDHSAESRNIWQLDFMLRRQSSAQTSFWDFVSWNLAIMVEWKGALRWNPCGLSFNVWHPTSDISTSGNCIFIANNLIWHPTLHVTSDLPNTSDTWILLTSEYIWLLTRRCSRMRTLWSDLNYCFGGNGQIDERLMFVDWCWGEDGVWLQLPGRSVHPEQWSIHLEKSSAHTHTHLEFITYRCQQNTKSTIEIVQEKPSVEPKACPRAEAGHGPESWRYDG